ncbi:hypothetical protein ACQPXH_08955 [Nocardia sp. CA-135953]|uniref:hypothetical protein n=1 Tax=Nocardia sp. CA-135953 TaxID=3239978 RepID=UPI003D97C122
MDLKVFPALNPVQPGWSRPVAIADEVVASVQTRGTARTVAAKGQPGEIISATYTHRHTEYGTIMAALLRIGELARFTSVVNGVSCGFGSDQRP